MGKWTDELTIEMLPEQFQQLAYTIGLSPLLSLVDQYGGADVYIPKRDKLLQMTRDRMLKREFNGRNIEELAHRYDLTVRRVKDILKDDLSPEQPTLLDIISGHAWR
jgi:Mor family transcriptional regulator